MQEINVSGVFVPAALIWALVAFFISALTGRILSRTGFYRWVWHRALFDFALFVLVWGALSAAAYHEAFSTGPLR